MKKKRIASVLLLLAVVLAAVAGIKTYVDYQVRAAAEREYESLAELARETEAPTEISTEAETEETEAPYVSPIQFDELRKINPDIVGWLKVEGTEIDYPIVQTGNNETYLNTDFEGKKSVAGAIYLDYESEPEDVYKRQGHGAGRSQLSQKIIHLFGSSFHLHSVILFHLIILIRRPVWYHLNA